MATPTAEAAIRPIVIATMTDGNDREIKTVARDSMKRSGSRSIMRTPIISRPASAATGIQAMKLPRKSEAKGRRGPR